MNPGHIPHGDCEDTLGSKKTNRRINRDQVVPNCDRELQQNACGAVNWTICDSEIYSPAKSN